MGTRPQQYVAEVFVHYYGDNTINEMEEWSMLIMNNATVACSYGIGNSRQAEEQYPHSSRLT